MKIESDPLLAIKTRLWIFFEFKIPVGPQFVKFLSLSNDSELYWTNAQIIFLAGFAGQWGFNKDATMTRRL
jgi:hypothetical protein